jgi:hypothetical protein
MAPVGARLGGRKEASCRDKRRCAVASLFGLPKATSLPGPSSGSVLTTGRARWYNEALLRQVSVAQAPARFHRAQPRGN